MKKIIAMIAAIAVVFMGMLAFAGTASATGGHGDNNKKVTFCHATASATNPYEKLTTSLSAFINTGHVDHVQGGNKDIYPEIKYTSKGGDVVTIPAQGDQSLLAFEDCKAPKVDEKVAKPTSSYIDKCGTKDDLFSVAPGRGYTVGPVKNEGNNLVITVTLEDGFAWAPDGNKQELRFVENAFTNEDCDLPETGGVAEFNTVLGGGVIALILAAGAGLFLYRRKA